MVFVGFLWNKVRHKEGGFGRDPGGEDHVGVVDQHIAAPPEIKIQGGRMRGPVLDHEGRASRSVLCPRKNQ